MARRILLLPIISLALLAPPLPALAHGFGERYDLPVPLWLYLWGAAAAVVLSFVLVGLFVGEQHVSHRYPRYNLLRLTWFRAAFASRPALLAVRSVSVGLLVVVVLAGLLGDQAPAFNIAPTFVWVIWWVGLSFFTALVGNLWPLLNPWKTLFEWADALVRRRGDDVGLELHEPYPARWGVWPALLLYAGFVWLEVVFEGSPTPRNIAVLALLYSAITWIGMAYFGKEVWLHHGEAFSVYFSVLARFAPTEVRVADTELCRACPAGCVGHPGAECVNCYTCLAWAEPRDRQLNLRPWAVGLLRAEPSTFDRRVFVVFLLSSVTFDGLVVTPFWDGLRGSVQPALSGLGTLGDFGFQTLGLIGLPALFLAIYLGASAGIGRLGGQPGRVAEVAGAFVYALVPIALAYQFAHYYTLFLIQGQRIIGLISDPFGWGWDLFGTASYVVNVGIVGAAFSWYSKVAFIVLGHVVAVYLAHVLALRLFRDGRRALRSQVPMLALMVLYTISSLWILSQPVVTENRTAASEGSREARSCVAGEDQSPAAGGREPREAVRCATNG